VKAFTRILLWMTMLAECGFVAAASPAVTERSQFEAANKLYEEKKFTEAASGYERIATNGVASPALWFNLGNACFKAGQIGRAIVAYRRAADSTPRDPDVRANLKFARNQVQGIKFQPPAWQQWFARGFSVNEWSTFTAIGVWLTFLCLTGAKVRPDLKSILSPTVKIFGVLTLVQIVGLSLALTVRAPQIAVVTVREVAMHNGPLEESAAPGGFALAHDGAELRVLDQKDEWLQVTDGARRIGWLKRSEVAFP
jgi:hypothetical protein